jgi:hypothetical protein
MFALFVVTPVMLSAADVVALPPLRAAAQQNQECVAVHGEINSITGPKWTLHSQTPWPTGLTFEKFSFSSRAIAVRTFKAAGAFNFVNHAANGRFPSSVSYSTASIIFNDNTYVSVI